MVINQLVYYIGEAVQYEAIVRDVREDGSMDIQVLIPTPGALGDEYRLWRTSATQGAGEGQVREIS